MCGILGFYGGDKELGLSMAHSLSHRGPDDEGVETDGRVTLGSRRLSILDLSRRGHMPMWTDDHSLAIVQNGEIYNFRELRAELEKEGITFKSDGDTEVLLQGFVKHGFSFFNRVRGMFACALYDSKAETLTLIRDPFGIKPLYYASVGTQFAFASEIKALEVFLRAHNQPLHLCAVGCAMYFTFGYAAHPYTVFEEIKKVSPGAVLTIALKTLSLKEDKIIWAEEPAESFEEAFKISVKRHLIADVPVGVFLSGGMDSTSLALMLKDLGAQISAFTVKIEGREDAHYARKIAEYAKLPYHELELSQEKFDDAYAHLWEFVDEPVADSALLTSFALSKEARKYVTVVLTGEGGDELFYGYERHKALASLTRVSSRLGLLESLSFVPLSLFFAPILRRAKLLEASLRDDLLEGYAEMASIGGALSDKTRALNFLHHTYAKENVSVSYLDEHVYLPNDLLYKTDIATMAHSLEARVPFLDNAVKTYADSLSLSEKLKDGVGKLPLKQFLEARLPKEMLLHKKEGFSAPLAHYLYQTHWEDIREACGELARLNVPGVSNAALVRMHRDESYARYIARKLPAFPFACLMLARVLRRYTIVPS